MTALYIFKQILQKSKMVLNKKMYINQDEFPMTATGVRSF